MARRVAGSRPAKGVFGAVSIGEPLVRSDGWADDGPEQGEAAMRIGFVGTGTMGTPIAGCLIARRAYAFCP